MTFSCRLVRLSYLSAYSYLNFQVLKQIKEASWWMNPCHGVAKRRCFFLSRLTCRWTDGLWEMNSTTGVGDWTVTFPPPPPTSLTLPSLAHHSSVTSLKRLVSLSLRVFVYRWAAGTPWHAGGLPMRLDGYSDATTWPDDLWKTTGGGWERDLLSCTDESLRPCLLSWAAVFLSCLFLVKKSVACLF